MKSNYINTNNNYKAVSFTVSFLIHLLLAAAIIFVINIPFNKAKINPQFIRADLKELNRPKVKEKNNLPEEERTENEKAKPEKEERKTEDKLADENGKSILNNITADTTSLNQIYHEPTLNVTIKYPKGWVFLDQDLKHVFRGVTFWSTAGIYNPPPYIHLEVRDKDMFSPSYYIHKTEFNGYRFYYNDPEDMDNQVMQTFYIRTNTDVDFSIRLIVNGKNAFNSFLPVFWGILKSFKFGSSIL